MGGERHKSKSRRRIVLALLWWSDERLLRGISQYAHEADWILDASGRHRSRLPLGLAVHGLITLSSGDLKRVSYVRSIKVPTVVLGVHGEKFGTLRVTGDEEAIGPMAVEHFMNCGLEHIALAAY